MKHVTCSDRQTLGSGSSFFFPLVETNSTISYLLFNYLKKSLDIIFLEYKTQVKVINSIKSIRNYNTITHKGANNFETCVLYK